MIHPFRIGLGTAGFRSSHECTTSVETALEVGYRHVDTAQLYETESAVGAALSRSDVPRSAVTIATKVHPQNMGYDEVIASVTESRERLEVDHIDLLYVHWPLGEYRPDETLSAFVELQNRGIVEHVGVSNFTLEMIERARDVLPVPIHAHQTEMHPLLQQTELLEDAQRRDYWLVAYSPFARGHVFDVPEVRQIAEKHGVSPAQVSLAWLAGLDNVAAVPKATGRAHLRGNLEAGSVVLDSDDVELIESIESTKRVMNERDSKILSRYGAHPQDLP